MQLSKPLAALAAALLAPFTAHAGSDPPLPNPVLFVGQVPVPDDFATIGSTFANHFPDPEVAARGGGLFLLGTDGSLRDLTDEAGFGSPGTFQGADSIAVRDPSVHPDGTRALFAMVIGAPTEQFDRVDTRWQLYEVTGLDQGPPASISPIPNQPTEFNNLSPVYSPDGRIVFTSDRPRNGAVHLYPQLDEYESQPTNSGLWSLDPTTGALQLLDHAPSGDFTPIVDSFGRIVFTRWDHLQRDQQADSDDLAILEGEPEPYGTFDWADESDAPPISPVERSEVFPEPRMDRTDLLEGTNLVGHRFNHFFPWMIHPDGTEIETLNHIGRHELHFYFREVFDDDEDIVDFTDATSGRTNPESILNFFQIEEDPLQAGRYFAVDAPEFGTHASGRIVALASPPSQNAGDAIVERITHPTTDDTVGDGDTPPPEHSGHYRDPLPLSDGALVASHTFETREAENDGTRPNPVARYDFRLRRVDQEEFDHLAAGATLLPSGITRTVQYYDPDVLVTWTGALWELQAVEVRTRPAPPVLSAPLPAPEAAVFANAGVDPEDFSEMLAAHDLALIVSRDVTTRDSLDRQQPFNLRVPGGTAQTIGAPGGMIYDVKYMQIFQGDQVRGIGFRDGRRVLARPMHGLAIPNPPTTGPEASVTLGDDGSMAALVPAHRALSWQLLDPAHVPVVRERYWLTFQAGEIRVCASCHGLTDEDQEGNLAPTNQPQALEALLLAWSTLFSDGFESGDTTAWGP